MAPAELDSRDATADLSDRESWCGPCCRTLAFRAAFAHCIPCHDLKNPRLNGEWDTRRRLGLEVPG